MADPPGHPMNARGKWWLLALAASFALAVWMFMMPSTPDTATEPALADRGSYQRENPDTAFEPSDWNLAPVAIVYVGALILIVVSCFVLMAAYPASLPDVARTLRIHPPGPLLQTDPQAEFRHVRAGEEKRLNAYYWTDKSKGTVHIPIEQAMKKLVQTGIPGFPKAGQ